jgi:long-chain acyl-CoA synthetase
VIESPSRPEGGLAPRPWLASYDPGVPPEVEVPEITVDGLLRRAAEANPARTAMDFYGSRTSYADLDRMVDQFAGLLRRAGLAPGDAVSLHLPTSPAFVISFLGALRAGCVAVPMSPLYVERELAVLMGQSRPRLSVTLDLLMGRVVSARAKAGESLRPPEGMASVIATGIQDSLPVPQRWLYPVKMRREGRWSPVAHTPETPNLFHLLHGAPAERVDSPARSSDPAVLQGTGGTTGLPKEAVLTHRNLVANAVQCQAVLAGGHEGPASVLCALPYFHIYGLTVAMNFALLLGATQVLLPKFDPDAVLAAIDRHKPRYFPGVPTFYAALNTHPGIQNHDLRSVEACISGAAPLPAPVQEQFEALTGGRLCEGYGLTEASPVTHVNPVKGRGKPGTIGLPLPGTDARLVDLATGADVAGPGQVGELLVRGPQVMVGYHERPGETARALRDGWLHTGDLATVDADGYFAIVDRIKDVIIVSGANVYPREVEEVLITHPGVAETVVVGMKSARRGEVPKAYVVLKPGATTTVDELHEFCAQNLASFKLPAVIEIRVSLPRSMVGKVLRRELIAENEAREAAAPGQD